MLTKRLNNIIKKVATLEAQQSAKEETIYIWNDHDSSGEPTCSHEPPPHYLPGDWLKVKCTTE